MTSQTVRRLNATLYRNRETLKPGYEMPISEFVKRFSRYFPYLKDMDQRSLQDRLKTVNAYSNINRLLAHSGMAMKSRNYYTAFKIIEQPKAKLKVNKRKIANIKRYNKTLKDGLKTTGGTKIARVSAKIENSISGKADTNFFPAY